MPTFCAESPKVKNMSIIKNIFLIFNNIDNMITGSFRFFPIEDEGGGIEDDSHD